ncbi:hypothetical protein JCM12298_25380 [Desulfothermus naphthae]
MRVFALAKWGKGRLGNHFLFTIPSKNTGHANNAHSFYKLKLAYFYPGKFHFTLKQDNLMLRNGLSCLKKALKNFAVELSGDFPN